MGSLKKIILGEVSAEPNLIFFQGSPYIYLAEYFIIPVNNDISTVF